MLALYADPASPADRASGLANPFTQLGHAWAEWLSARSPIDAASTNHARMTMPPSLVAAVLSWFACRTRFFLSHRDDLSKEGPDGRDGSVMPCNDFPRKFRGLTEFFSAG